MVAKSVFHEAVEEHAAGSGFEAAARAHLKALEDAGETPEQIVRQLSDVVASYATEGLQDEANALREVIRQYQSR
jgi:phosphoketolase